MFDSDRLAGTRDQSCLRRPAITWPYLLGDDGVEALPWDTTEARILRLNADAILKADTPSGRPSPAATGWHPHH